MHASFAINGCIYAVQIRDGGVGLCPFCRTPTPTTDGATELHKKRVEAGDAEAIRGLGFHYSEGNNGLPRDMNKALDLWQRAVGLGNKEACNDIGIAYLHGEGVEIDVQKARHYWELGAMRGDDQARYNFGVSELQAKNYERAIKHLIIAAGGGYTGSLTTIRQMLMNGEATKDEYAKVLQSYQADLNEIKSKQRDEAAQQMIGIVISNNRYRLRMFRYDHQQHQAI